MRKKLWLIAILLVLVIAMIAIRQSKEKESSVSGEEQVSVFAMQQEEHTQRELSVELGAMEKFSAEGGLRIICEDEQGEQKISVFEDIDIDSMYAPAVNYAVSVGAMSAVEDDSGHSLFRGDYGVTRAQFAQMLYCVLGGEAAVEGNCPYQDVSPDASYHKAVCWVSEKGYLSGIGEDTFGVDEYLNCEQVLIVLHRAAGSPKSDATLENYPYAQKVSDYGRDAITWAWGIGLIAEDDHIWYPTQTISRIQMAMLLMRYDLLVGIDAAED